MGKVCMLKKYSRCPTHKEGQSPAHATLFSVPAESHLQEQYIERLGWPSWRPFPQSGFICAAHFHPRDLYFTSNRSLRKDGLHTLPMELEVPLYQDEAPPNTNLPPGVHSCSTPLVLPNPSTPAFMAGDEQLDEPFEPTLGVSTPFVTPQVTRPQGANNGANTNGFGHRPVRLCLTGDTWSDLSSANTTNVGQNAVDPTWSESASRIDHSLLTHESDGCDSDEDESVSIGPVPMKYVIVSYKKLNELLQFCPTCGHPVAGLQWQKRRLGAYIGADITCTNTLCHGYSWRSSGIRKKMPEVNFDLAAAMVVTGRTASTMKEFADDLGLPFPTAKTVQETSAAYLYPAVQEEYEFQEQHAVEKLKSENRPLLLAGDACFTSPGHCAKYGIYVLLNLVTRMILTFSFLQCSEASSSKGMEKLGLERSLQHVTDECGLKVQAICTDRDLSVRKFLRETYQRIKHYFDVWHVAKGLKKELSKAAVRRENRELFPWIKLITNQLWYAVQQCNGSYDELLRIWLSTLYHVRGIHSWTDRDGTKRTCGHKPFPEEDEREIEWLDDNSSAFRTLEKIVTSSRLLKDLQQCTAYIFTSDVENFFSMRLKYLPKRTSLRYQAAKAMTQLAVMDHNENVGRGVATDRQGNEKVSNQFSKATKARKLKDVKVSKTYFFRESIKARAVSLHWSASGTTAKNATVSRFHTAGHLPKSIAKVPLEECDLNSLQTQHQLLRQRRASLMPAGIQALLEKTSSASGNMLNPAASSS